MESALADFYEGKEMAAGLRAEARRKAERLVADGEMASAIPEEAARKAVVAVVARGGVRGPRFGLCPGRGWSTRR